MSKTKRFVGSRDRRKKGTPSRLRFQWNEKARKKAKGKKTKLGPLRRRIRSGSSQESGRGGISQPSRKFCPSGKRSRDEEEKVHRVLENAEARKTAREAPRGQPWRPQNEIQKKEEKEPGTPLKDRERSHDWGKERRKALNRGRGGE